MHLGLHCIAPILLVGCARLWFWFRIGHLVVAHVATGFQKHFLLQNEKTYAVLPQWALPVVGSFENLQRVDWTMDDFLICQTLLSKRVHIKDEASLNAVAYLEGR